MESKEEAINIFELNCKTDIPSLPGVTDQELTVGRVFYWVCEGVLPKDLQVDHLHLVLLGADGKEAPTDQSRWELKILGIEMRNPTTLDLKLTSYGVGTHAYSKVSLTDGHNSLILGPQEFQVKSVLDPKEKNEGFGPIGPTEIPIPPLYWLVLGGLIVFFAVAILAKIIILQKKRKLKKELESYEVKETPAQQFYQSLRKLRRRYHFMDSPKGNSAPYSIETQHEIFTALTELRRMFQIYILRKYQILAIHLEPKQILKKMAVSHKRIISDHGTELRQLLFELESHYRKGEREKQNVDFLDRDLVQIARIMQRVIDELERST